MKNIILPKLEEEQTFHVAYMAKQLLNEVESLATQGLEEENRIKNSNTILPKIIEILKSFSSDYQKH